MKSYHFDVGNSTDGSLGFCARVRAENENEAVALLQDALEALCDGLPVWDDKEDAYLSEEPQGIEYVRVYFGPQKLAVEDIDESHEVKAGDV